MASALILCAIVGLAGWLLLKFYLCGTNYCSTKRLDGQTAAVTGANAGIGLVTARELCRRGARVLLLCRDLDRGRAAVEVIRHELKSEERRTVGELVLVRLDLASLASVRQCAGELLRREKRLELLVLNAGVMWSPLDTRTADGFETQMGTNHLGHFLLARLLTPLLVKTGCKTSDLPFSPIMPF